tara:strand:+ start:2575 stop:2757 length:183 start_codon:yes stop_codon:yes gene_type:complete
MRTLDIPTFKEHLKTKSREYLLRITLIILDEYEKSLNMLEELYGKVDELSNHVSALEEEE